MGAEDMLDRVLEEQKQEAEGDHDLFSHLFGPTPAVTEAYINGTPVTALCGKTWVPSRNPEKHQLCPRCKELLDMARAAKGNA